MRQGGVGGDGGMAQQIGHCVVSEERSACIWDHAEEGGRETAEEVGHASLRHTSLDDGCCGVGERVRGVVQGGRGLFVVYFSAYARQGAPLVGRGFKGQADAYHFQRICKEDGDHAGQAARNKAAARRLACAVGNDGRSYLVVGQELDACVGEDAEERG